MNKMSNIFFITALAFLFLRLITALSSLKQQPEAYQEIYIDTEQCVFESNARFLSIALDSSLIRRKWEKFNFTSEKLQNLANGLRPAYLRLGGTDEDFLLFAEDNLMRKVHNSASSSDKHRQATLTQRDTSNHAPNILKATAADFKVDANRTMANTSKYHDVSRFANTFKNNAEIQHHVKTPKVSTTFRVLNETENDDNTNFTMNVSDVDNIFQFAKKAGLDIIFGLNLLLRTPEGDWDSSNAEKLMVYVTGKQYTCGWELGNEPVDLKGLVNFTITGKQLAKDFNKLRELLTKHPGYGSLIVGPDVSSPWNGDIRPAFLEDFLANINNSTLDGVTYHQYYTNNQASVSDFYDPNILDSLIKEMQQVEDIAGKTGTRTPLWLGETSSAYGGGVPGVSDSYIAGFMWLDKLGVAARFRHNIVIRQVFYGGSYSLIDRNTFDPYPDYWTSLLYKILVGPKALEVRGGLTLGRKVRVYAHCTSERSSYPHGAIVVFALNTLHEDTQLVFMDELQGLPVEEYVLTPGHDGNLTSQTIKLNNELLLMVDDKLLPDIKPKRIVPPQKISLPPVSYGFFVIPDANAKACISKRSYPNGKRSMKV